MVGMSKESRINPLWYVVGLIVVGFVAWGLLKILFSLFLYLIIGAVVVGAIVMLTNKGRRSVGGNGRRSIDR
jgi:hypothetical protein